MIQAEDRIQTGYELGYDSPAESQHAEMHDEMEDSYIEFLHSLEKELYGSPKKTSHLIVPRKPLIPYLRFLIEYQAQNKSVITGESPKSISEKIRRLWVDLPALKKACITIFIFFHQKEYVHSFEQEYSQYRILLDEFHSLTKPPKKPQSAYLIFFYQESKNLHNADPNRPYSEITKELSVKWKNMSQDEKEQYNKIALERKQKYEKDLQEYQFKQDDQKIIDRYIQNKKNYEIMIKESNQIYKNPVKIEKQKLKNYVIEGNEESEDEYEEYSKSSNFSKKKIENIIGVKVKNGNKQYLIKWIGVPYPVWTKAQDLEDHQKLIDLFEDMFIKPVENKQQEVPLPNESNVNQDNDQKQNKIQNSPGEEDQKEQIKKGEKPVKVKKIENSENARSRSRNKSKEQQKPVLNARPIRQTKKNQKYNTKVENNENQLTETKKEKENVRKTKKQSKNELTEKNSKEQIQTNNTDKQIRKKYLRSSVDLQSDINKTIQTEPQKETPAALKKLQTRFQKTEKPSETENIGLLKKPSKIPKEAKIKHLEQPIQIIKSVEQKGAQILETFRSVSKRTRSHINLKTEDFISSQVDEVKLETPKNQENDKKIKNNSKNKKIAKQEVVNEPIKPQRKLKIKRIAKPKIAKRVSKITTRSQLKKYRS